MVELVLSSYHQRSAETDEELNERLRNTEKYAQESKQKHIREERNLQEVQEELEGSRKALSQLQGEHGQLISAQRVSSHHFASFGVFFNLATRHTSVTSRSETTKFDELQSSLKYLDTTIHRWRESRSWRFFSTSTVH